MNRSDYQQSTSFDAKNFELLNCIKNEKIVIINSSFSCFFKMFEYAISVQIRINAVHQKCEFNTWYWTPSNTFPHRKFDPSEHYSIPSNNLLIRKYNSLGFWYFFENHHFSSFFSLKISLFYFTVRFHTLNNEMDYFQFTTPRFKYRLSLDTHY